MHISAGSVSTWLHFAIGAGVFVAVAGVLDFVSNTRTRAAVGAQTLSSLYFGLLLLVAAGIGATLLWLGMRVVKGRNRVQDFRDSVLWSACLIGGLVMLVRMVR
jgi:uncharacterized membrane protein